MTNEYQIRVVPEVAAQEDRLKAYLADEQGIDVRTIYVCEPEGEGVCERAAS